MKSKKPVLYVHKDGVYILLGRFFLICPSKKKCCVVNKHVHNRGVCVLLSQHIQTNWPYDERVGPFSFHFFSHGSADLNCTTSIKICLCIVSARTLTWAEETGSAVRKKF